MDKEPGSAVRRVEAEAALPTGTEECFAGYGIMRLPSVTLAAVPQVARSALGAGRLRLRVREPNGQRFRATPRRRWVVEQSCARIGGADLGAPGPLTPQAGLGDFPIPQRGLFVIGSAFFDPGDADTIPPRPAVRGG